MRRRVTIWTSPDIIDTRITRTPKIKRIPNPHPFSDGVPESFFVFILLSVLICQQVFQYFFSVVDEKFRYLIAGCFFVRAAVNRPFVKAADLRIGNSQQNGRMGGNDKLRTFLHTPDDFPEQCQLSLRRQGRFGFVQKIQAIRTEIVMYQSKKTLPV